MSRALWLAPLILVACARSGFEGTPDGRTLAGDTAFGDCPLGDRAPGDRDEGDPGDRAPGDDASGDGAPGDRAPGDDAPGDDASGDGAPGDAPGDGGLGDGGDAGDPGCGPCSIGSACGPSGVCEPCVSDTQCGPDCIDCTISGATCNPTRNRCEVATCAGAVEYAPCNLVTVPERSDDFCSSGTCVSSGCGDLSCNPDGPRIIVPDTGQIECYEDFTAIPCPTGPDCSTIPGCGQDAQYGWDVDHLPGERFVVGEAVVGQPIVRDTVTTLTWQRCVMQDCNGAVDLFHWTDALAHCEDLTWAGYDDWRLPDVFELESIHRFGLGGASLWSVFDDSVYDYWTSTTAHMDTSSALFHRNVSVTVISYQDKTTWASVRCVRGQPLRVRASSQRFERTGSTEPIVTDAATGLTWMGCLAGNSGTNCQTGTATTMAIHGALSLCEASTWAGFDDWRVPNVLELDSLNADVDPAGFDSNAFRDASSDPVWASTARNWSSRLGIRQAYPSGGIGSFYTRCVRGP